MGLVDLKGDNGDWEPTRGTSGFPDVRLPVDKLFCGFATSGFGLNGGRPLVVRVFGVLVPFAVVSFFFNILSLSGNCFEGDWLPASLTTGFKLIFSKTF